MASPSGALPAPDVQPGSRAHTPDPNLSPRDRLAALMAQWRNTAAPATVDQAGIQEYQRRIEDQKIREGLYGHERKIWGSGEKNKDKRKRRRRRSRTRNSMHLERKFGGKGGGRRNNKEKERGGIHYMLYGRIEPERHECGGNNIHRKRS